MGSSLASQAARWLAMFLVGAGLGGVAQQVGVGAAASTIGALAAIGATLYVLVSTVAWNGEVARSIRSSEPFDAFGLLGPWLFRGVSIGLIGVGVVIGTEITWNPATLVAGVAGLVVLVLVRGRAPA